MTSNRRLKKHQNDNVATLCDGMDVLREPSLIVSSHGEKVTNKTVMSTALAKETTDEIRLAPAQNQKKPFHSFLSTLRLVLKGLVLILLFCYFFEIEKNTTQIKQTTGEDTIPDERAIEESVFLSIRRLTQKISSDNQLPFHIRIRREGNYFILSDIVRIQHYVVQKISFYVAMKRANKNDVVDGSPGFPSFFSTKTPQGSDSSSSSISSKDSSFPSPKNNLVHKIDGREDSMIAKLMIIFERGKQRSINKHERNEGRDNSLNKNTDRIIAQSFGEKVNRRITKSIYITPSHSSTLLQQQQQQQQQQQKEYEIDSNMDTNDQKSLMLSSNEYILNNDDSDFLIEPGMILEVITQIETSYLSNDDICESVNYEKGENEDCDNDYHDTVQYELMEMVHDELGLIDMHSIDFAYHPPHNPYTEYQFQSKSEYTYSSANDGNDDLDNNMNLGATLRLIPAGMWPRNENNNNGNRNAYSNNDKTSSSGEELVSSTYAVENFSRRSNIYSSWLRTMLYLKSFVTVTDNSSTSSSLSTSTNANMGRDSFSSKYEKMGERAFAGGSQGEVWRARRKCPPISSSSHRRSGKDGEEERTSQQKCDNKTKLIVKRLKVESGFHLLEAGLREVYFGKLLLQHTSSPSTTQKEKKYSDESKQLFTNYVDHFFRESSSSLFRRSSTANSLELWIVYEDAGPSLRSYLYTPMVADGGFVVYQHSAFWRHLRMGNAMFSKSSSSSSSMVAYMMPPTSQNNEAKPRYHSQNIKSNNTGAEGKILMRETLRQLLTAAAYLHEHGIVHRDIKPSNIMCESLFNNSSFDDEEEGAGKDKAHQHSAQMDGEVDNHGDTVSCVLGDFSSAWDSFTSNNMYMNGPSAAEQTDEYAPPEVLLSQNWIPFDPNNPSSYDSWSIGIVALEMLLGTPHVFTSDQRTTTILENSMRRRGASPDDIKRALYLAALSQFCIYVPTIESSSSTSSRSNSAGIHHKSWPYGRGHPLHLTAVVKQTCTIQDFHNALRARDPLGIGFDSSTDNLLELIWGLLSWDPSKRVTAAQALKHPYFQKGIDHDHHHHHGVDENNKAMTPQLLDPKISATIEESKTRFVCPKCGKSFETWNSCHVHMSSRRHGQFCDFNRTIDAVPQCLNAHSMLPAHPTSGYCDIQGRRRTIEDFHSIHLHQDHQFYGVFDGHWGNLASKYSARFMYRKVKGYLHDIDEHILSDGDIWKKKAEENLNDAFHDLHNGFLQEAVAMSPGGIMVKSGTTATILMVTNEAVIVANVGDSRAILSIGASYDDNDNDINTNNPTPQTRRKDLRSSASALQLTFDHIASDPQEKLLIESKGGFIKSSGTVDRVNGTLAVTRSIGNVPMMSLLSRSPHVWAMRKKDVQNICQKQQHKYDDKDTTSNSVQTMPCFVILASDGLWDVVSNQEAIDLVISVLRKYRIEQNSSSSFEMNEEEESNSFSWEDGGAFQLAAQYLTQEAYVRGSTDNIGVCVVAIV